MTVTNGYCTLAELQGVIASTGTTIDWTAEDVANMETAIEAISRWLDEHFETSFYARTETRYFTAMWGDLVYTDDLLSITALKTDEDGDGTYGTTWSASDYWLEPRNAALGPQPKPYRQIRANPNGDHTFPTRVYGVEIEASWGYCTEDDRPPAIKQATLLAAHRIWKRKDTIFGVAGSPAATGIQTVIARLKQDSDFLLLLEGVDRRGF